MRSLKHIGGLSLVLAVAPFCLAKAANAAGSTFTWAGGATASAWLTTTNWSPSGPPGVSDIASFTSATTSPLIGINLNGSTNNGANNEAVGEIMLASGNTTARTIGNSSAATSGILTLNGVSGVSLLNASAVGLTLQNVYNSVTATAPTMTVNLASTAAIEIDAAGGITINSVITGTNGLTKTGTGTGTLTLGGTNTYTGGTSISAGSLTVTGNGSLSTGAVSNAGSLIFSLASAQTYANAISGAGTLTTNGALLTLTGANTYTGQTTINAGGLTVDASQGGSLTATPLQLNGGSFNLIGSNTAATSQTVGAITLGADSVASIGIQSGAGQSTTLAIGSVTRSAGDSVINFSLSDPSGGTSAITSSGTNTNGIIGGFATFNNASFATISGGNVVASTGTTATTTNFNNPATNLDISSSLTPTGGTALAANSLRFVGTAANTLTLTGNTLTVTSGGILDTPTAGGAVSISGGTLTSGDVFSTGKGFLFLTQNNTASTMSISSVIADSAANSAAIGVVKSGAGTLTLSGTNTFTGGLFILGGTVQAASSTYLGATPTSASTALTFNNGGTLLYTNTTSLTAISANRQVVLDSGGGVIGVQNAGVSVNNASVISGSGSLTKIGPGTLYLNQANNTYTGGTFLTAGTLEITGGASLGATTAGNGGVTFTNGATLLFDSNVSANGIGSTRPFILGTGGGVVNVNGNTFTYGGSISGTGGITFNNTSTTASVLTLSGSSGFSGGLTLNSGTIVATTVGAIGSTANTLTVNGGTLSIAGVSPTFAGLSSTTSAGTINNSSSTTATKLTINEATGNSSTYSGTIANGGTAAFALTKSGAGTLTLTGASTYTGATTISAGTLIASNTGVSNASAVTVASGATLGVGEALNTTASPQATGTLSALSLAVISAAGNAVPALTFNLGANNVSDMLTLTGGTTPFTFSGAGPFNIGFADATGAGLGPGTYTLVTLTTAEAMSSAPVIGNYVAVPNGNLGSISNAMFNYTTDSTGNVTGLTLSIGGAADGAMPEPSTFALIGFGALAFVGQVTRRRRSA